jgi:WD40 repeat protein
MCDMMCCVILMLSILCLCDVVLCFVVLCCLYSQLHLIKLLHTLRGHTDWVFSLTYNNTPTPTIISCSRDCSVRLWDPSEKR